MASRSGEMFYVNEVENEVENLADNFDRLAMENPNERKNREKRRKEQNAKRIDARMTLVNIRRKAPEEPAAREPVAREPAAREPVAREPAAREQSAHDKQAACDEKNTLEAYYQQAAEQGVQSFTEPVAHLELDDPPPLIRLTMEERQMIRDCEKDYRVIENLFEELTLKTSDLIDAATMIGNAMVLLDKITNILLDHPHLLPLYDIQRKVENYLEVAYEYMP